MSDINAVAGPLQSAVNSRYLRPWSGLSLYSPMNTGINVKTSESTTR